MKPHSMIIIMIYMSASTFKLVHHRTDDGAMHQ